MTCDRWAVAVVPFPFTDRPISKLRPCLALSGRDFNAAGHTVMSMITSRSHRSWPGDVVVADLARAGLPAACLVRLKLFTIDNRLIRRLAGELGEPDRAAVREALTRFVLPGARPSS